MLHYEFSCHKWFLFDYILLIKTFIFKAFCLTLVKKNRQNGEHNNSSDSSSSSYHMLDPVLPRRRSWPDFMWSLSLPRLAISFNHMHPLFPVHFSSSHSLLAFSTFVSVFLFLYYHSLQISKASLSHFDLFSSKHDRTTIYCLL